MTGLPAGTRPAARPPLANPSRWWSEPLVTGALVLGIYTLWQVSYSSNAVLSGEPLSRPVRSGFDFAVQNAHGVLQLAVPVLVWAALVIAGNALVRRRGFLARACVAFAVSGIPCAYVALRAWISLAQNDGWRGLGMVGLLIPLVVPFLVLGLYCVAAGLLSFRDTRRREGAPPREQTVPSR